MNKEFITVTAEHRPDGHIRPLSLEWTDGRVYTIKVLDVRLAPSLKCGGQGMRYTCRIGGKQVYLFCDEGKWFVEV